MSTTKIKDHLGNEFPSINAMCRYHNIKMSNYTNRINHGMSVEEALTTPLLSTETKDHLGNTYPSESAMCKHYNISIGTYKSRLKRGMSMKDALECSLKQHPCDCKATDHLGNEFESQKAMCKHYGMSVKQFRERIKLNWSLEKILTTPFKSKGPVKDHLGNEFESQKAMCKHYNISFSSYTDRLRKGMSLEEVLTRAKPGEDLYHRTDHLGNVFTSKADMCRHYGVPEKTFERRLSIGLSKEEALTNEPYYNQTIYTDHLGNKGTISQLANIHNISANVLISRLKLGWTMEQALTRPLGWRITDIYDHHGKQYPSATALAEAYNLNLNTLQYRQQQGWSTKACLIIPNYFRIKIECKLFDGYEIVDKIDDNYYECKIDDQCLIRHASQIYDDYADYLEKNDKKGD